MAHEGTLLDLDVAGVGLGKKQQANRSGARRFEALSTSTPNPSLSIVLDEKTWPAISLF